MSIFYDNCPSCGASMVGDPIPEHMHHCYSPPYYWSRAIGIYSQELDRTVRYQCPDCGATLREKA